MNIKDSILILIAMFTICLVIFSRRNVVGNDLYYILLVIETILLSIFLFKYFKVSPLTKNLNTLKIILGIFLASYFVLIPFNDFITIMSSNRNEKIVFDGKVIRAGLTSGRFKSFNVTFEFANGKQKTWEISRNYLYYDEGKIIAEQLILNNYWKYKKIQVIGYKSPFGIHFAYFRAVEE